VSGSVTLVCSQCSATVRVPAARMAEAPHCPTCKALLVDGKPLTLTAATFDRQVGRTSLPVVVDFWAPWCGPCLRMAPFFEQVSQKLSTKLRFAKLDTEAQPAVAARFNIRSIPTLIVFRDGREVARLSGAMDASQLTRWLAANSGSDLQVANL
jgi:thioredoxin 2